MADTKISALPSSTTPLAGTEVLPIVQSSTTRQVTVANLTAGRAVATGALTVTGAISATGTLSGGSSTGYSFNGSAPANSLKLDSSGNLGVGTTSPATGLSLLKYGSQWTNHTTNTYTQPAGNTFLQMEALAAQTNWFGFTGTYGATSGSANLLLQVNVNNTSQQAGNYIASEAQSATAADLTFGKMIGGATTGANSTKSEFMRLDSSGNLLVGATAVGNGGKLYINGSISLGTTAGGTQSSMAKDTTQLTSSISTSATTIYTDISSGLSSASAGYFIIYGNNNAGAGFMDVVIAKASGTPVVVSSSTVEGSPPARTYSVSSFALQLTMASGTFNVNLKATVIGFPF